MKLEIVWIALKFIALIFTSFELFSIITNKNKKMSIAGTLVLAFSGCVIWNLDKFDSLILGGLITVLINKIIEEKSYKKIIPMILIIIVSSVIYMYTFRPFAISFGYVFLALITWLILNNIKELKGNKSKIITICLAIGLSIVAAICAEIFGKNVYSDYIESSTSAGISGIFTYLYTPLLGIKNVSHSDIWAGIVSVFPIPMCIALYHIYTKEKHAEFLFPISVVAVLETVYCISGFPQIISKITMFAGISAVRVVPAVQFANLLIMFYFLGNVKESLFKLRTQIRITIISVCILALIKYPEQVAGYGFLYLFAAEFALLTFMFLNYSDKNYQKVFLKLITIISALCGISALFFI